MSTSEMKKISKLPSELFDGMTNPYVPGKELQYCAKLHLHTDHDTEVDPITFEVIRHALWIRCQAFCGVACSDILVTIPCRRVVTK